MVFFINVFLSNAFNVCRYTTVNEGRGTRGCLRPCNASAPWLVERRVNRVTLAWELIKANDCHDGPELRYVLQLREAGGVGEGGGERSSTCHSFFHVSVLYSLSNEEAHVPVIHFTWR